MDKKRVLISIGVMVICVIILAVLTKLWLKSQGLDTAANYTQSIITKIR